MDIYLQGMRDRSVRSGTELAREIKLTNWSMAGNLSNRSSGVQIPRDICTRLKRYLYSAKCSWIIMQYIALYNNQINARALIGQSAVGYCAGKHGKIARLLNYYIKAIDHKFSMGYRLINHLGCW